jgi:hypothetical protein
MVCWVGLFLISYTILLERDWRYFGDGIVAYWAGTGVLDCALVRVVLVKVGN